MGASVQIKHVLPLRDCLIIKFSNPVQFFRKAYPIPVYNPSRFSINTLFSSAAVIGVELK